MRKGAWRKMKAGQATAGKKADNKKLLMIAALITNLFYIIWRICFTIPVNYGVVSFIAGIALLTSEAVGVLEAAENYLNSFSKEPEMPKIPDCWYPDVDVFVATHNESKDMLYKTINGCLNMAYPDPDKVHIFICDDGDRKEIADMARNLGVGYFGLSGNDQAKAGNLNNALRQTNSVLVATFDADMIPTSRFLMETVPYFFLPEMEKDTNGNWRERKKCDEGYKIGFIQTPQSFYHADLFQFNLFAEDKIPNEQDYFFREVNVGRNRTNSAIYAGSNTLISRKALEEAGYIKTGTITEDFATGIEIQQRGYTCYAVDKTLAHGTTPTDVESLIKQRERWGRGCIQTLRSMKFWFGPLPLGTKLSYLSSLLYWWTFFRRFVYISAPILFTVFGVRIVDCNLLHLVLLWLPAYLLYNRALKVMSGNLRNQRWNNIIDTIIFPYLILPMLLESIGVKQKKFSVTRKDRPTSRQSDIKYACPHIILASASVVGLAFCLWDLIINRWIGSLILIYWLAMNLYFLIMAIFFMKGRVNFRQEERFRARIPVKVAAPSGFFEGWTADVSESGLAILLDTPVYLPYDEPFTVTLQTGKNRACLPCEVISVAQGNEGWKYSMKRLYTGEHDYREYLSILYDRDHTLSRTMKDTGFVSDLVANMKGRTTLGFSSNRRLPRISIGGNVRLLEGGEARLEDFNYEFVLMSGLFEDKEELTVDLGRGILLKCSFVNEVRDGKFRLYRVEDWKNLACNPHVLEQILICRSKKIDDAAYTI